MTQKFKIGIIRLLYNSVLKEREVRLALALLCDGVAGSRLGSGYAFAIAPSH